MAPARNKPKAGLPLIVKLLIAAVATLVVLVALAPSFWTLREERKLKQQIAALRAAGEPMSAEDLPVLMLPEGQNASLDYKAAAKLIDTTQTAWKKWNDSDSRKEEFHPPFTADEVVTMNAIVAENQAPLKLVAQARGKPIGDWQDRWVRPYLTSTQLDLNSERHLANLLSLAAFAAHADGRDDEAIEHLNDLLRLQQAALQRPMLVAHLVAIGIDSMASQTAWEIAPELRVGPGGADATAVSSLMARFANERPLQEGRWQCWRTERICMLDSYQGVISGSFPGQSGKPLSDPRLSATGYLLKGSMLADARMMLVHIQGIELAADAPDWPAARMQMPTALPAAIDAHPALHLISSILLPAVGRAVQMDYIAVAHRHLALAAIAARLYTLDHRGQLPQKLTDLVPAYLPAVPTDPLSGGLLLYKNQPDQPRIYSVGMDAIDDGGIAEGHLSDKRRPRYNGDIVANLRIQPRPADEGDGTN